MPAPKGSPQGAHLSFYSQNLGSSHSWRCPLCFFWRSHNYQHCDFLFEFLQLIYLHCATWLLLRSHFTLAFKSLITYQLTLYLLPLYPHHHLMFLVVFYASCFFLGTLLLGKKHQKIVAHARSVITQDKLQRRE